MKVIGLTGGIATGKSTVARLLRDELGVPIVDADLVAREVVSPGSAGLQAIVDRFGPEMLLGDGGLDRARLRACIVADSAARKDLEAITHPAIAASIATWLEDQRTKGVTAAVVEAALMVETGSYRRYDALLVVTCRPETQLDRLIHRDGHTEAEARALIATQLPLAAKEAVATALIRNDGTAEDLRRATFEAWREISR